MLSPLILQAGFRVPPSATQHLLWCSGYKPRGPPPNIMRDSLCHSFPESLNVRTGSNFGVLLDEAPEEIEQEGKRWPRSQESVSCWSAEQEVPNCKYRYWGRCPSTLALQSSIHQRGCGAHWGQHWNVLGSPKTGGRPSTEMIMDPPLPCFSAPPPMQNAHCFTVSNNCRNSIIIIIFLDENYLEYILKYYFYHY